VYEVPELTMRCALRISSQNGESSGKGAMSYVVFGGRVSHIYAVYI
jgi:hypothetical protein